MDQYCLLVLLYLINPVVVSLRSLQQASQLKKVQKKLGCARASLGTLSESTDVFEPERLREIIGELANACCWRSGPMAGRRCGHTKWSASICKAGPTKMS
jgi:hypothetical protein